MTTRMAPICIAGGGCEHFLNDQKYPTPATEARAAAWRRAARARERRHLTREEKDAGVRTGYCAAFPSRIPVDIWHSRHDHRQPYDGDHGIHYLPRGPRASDYARRLFDDDNAPSPRTRSAERPDETPVPRACIAPRFVAH